MGMGPGVKMSVVCVLIHRVLCRQGGLDSPGRRGRVGRVCELQKALESGGWQRGQRLHVTSNTDLPDQGQPGSCHCWMWYHAVWYHTLGTSQPCGSKLIPLDVIEIDALPSCGFPSCPPASTRSPTGGSLSILHCTLTHSLQPLTKGPTKTADTVGLTSLPCVHPGRTGKVRIAC